LRRLLDAKDRRRSASRGDVGDACRSEQQEDDREKPRENAPHKGIEPQKITRRRVDQLRTGV
jgi:hypothetical protein